MADIVRVHSLTFTIIAFVLGAAMIVFPLSYLSNSNVVIGLCLLPLALIFSGNHHTNYLYLIMMVFFGTIGYLFHVRIFYFYTLGFYLLFVLEACVGRTNPLALFLLAFMSPVFEQVSVIMSFPIRLTLSKWAGYLLSMTGLHTQTEGNLILVNGAPFAVDDACMGLNLLSVSMLMGVFILAHQYRKGRVELAWWPLSVFFFAVFMLNIVCNLLRIIILVAFEISPGSPMHDGIGILCFITYVVVPLWFLANQVICRCGRKSNILVRQPSFSTPFKRAFIGGLAVVVVWLGFHIEAGHHRADVVHPEAKMAGFLPKKIAGGILRMYDGDLLVYIKPIPEFFSSEHTPLICWKGSGYQFGSVKKVLIEGVEVYAGTLTRQGQILYTAWWYDNGRIRTISQLDWRARMLRAEPGFCLVNATAANEDLLFSRLQSIFVNELLVIGSEATNEGRGVPLMPVKNRLFPFDR